MTADDLHVVIEKSDTRDPLARQDILPGCSRPEYTLYHAFFLEDMTKLRGVAELARFNTPVDSTFLTWFYPHGYAHIPRGTRGGTRAFLKLCEAYARIVVDPCHPLYWRGATSFAKDLCSKIHPGVDATLGLPITAWIDCAQQYLVDNPPRPAQEITYYDLFGFSSQTRKL